MAVEIATAYISLVPSMRGARGTISREMTPAARTAGREGGRQYGGGFSPAPQPAARLAAAAGAVGFLKGSIEEAREAQKVGAQTEQVIKTTGSAAKVTAKQVGDLSTAISN